MTPQSPADDEWAFPNSATPLGSAPYYAIRFSAPAARETGALLFAWFDLVERMTANPQDPGVVRLKLDWWRQELGTLANGEVRHPLAISLQPLGLGDAAVDEMKRLLDSAETEVLEGPPANPEAFVRRCEAAGGALFTLLGHSEPDNTHDKASCMRNGGYWLAVERVRHMVAAPGRLPPNLLSALTENPDSEERRTGFAQLIPQPETGSATEPAPIPEIARRLLATNRTLHRKMVAQDFPIADKLVDRMPLAHLWTAWRCR